MSGPKQSRPRQPSHFPLIYVSCDYAFVGHGGLAQLGERGVRNAEVGGSNPLPSTNFC